MKDKNSYKKLSIYIIIASCIGGLLYGFDIGAISGAIIFIRKVLNLGTSHTSFIMSAVFGGCVLATLISGPLADFMGRKKMLVFSATNCWGYFN